MLTEIMATDEEYTRWELFLIGAFFTKRKEVTPVIPRKQYKTSLSHEKVVLVAIPERQTPNYIQTGNIQYLPPLRSVHVPEQPPIECGYDKDSTTFVYPALSTTGIETYEQPIHSYANFVPEMCGRDINIVYQVWKEIANKHVFYGNVLHNVGKFVKSLPHTVFGFVKLPAEHAVAVSHEDVIATSDVHYVSHPLGQYT